MNVSKNAVVDLLVGDGENKCLRDYQSLPTYVLSWDEPIIEC